MSRKLISRNHSEQNVFISTSVKEVTISSFEWTFMYTNCTYQSRWFYNRPPKHLTLRKCRVAKKSGESVSCAFAHCSANGVKASRQSWQTSELILIMKVKEQTRVDILTKDKKIIAIIKWKWIKRWKRIKISEYIGVQYIFTELCEKRFPMFLRWLGSGTGDSWHVSEYNANNW